MGALVLLGSIVDLLMFPKSAAAGFSWKYFGHIFSHFLSFLKKNSEIVGWRKLVEVFFGLPVQSWSHFCGGSWQPGAEGSLMAGTFV